MEEKKRRPRITKAESDAPLKEPEQGDNQEKQSSETPGFERWSPPREMRDQPPPYDRRRPYDSNRPYQRDRNEGGDRSYDRPRYDQGNSGASYNRPQRDRSTEGGNYNRERGSGDRPYREGTGHYNRSGSGDRPYRDRPEGDNYNRDYSSDRPYRPRPEGDNYNRDRSGDRPYRPRPEGDNYNRERSGDRPYRPRPEGDYYNRERSGDRPYEERSQYSRGGGGYRDRNEGAPRKPFGRSGMKRPPLRRKNDDYVVERKPKPEMPTGEGMPLNKYLAHCGMSSRRKAVEYIEQGKVLINGEAKTEPFYRIQPGDVVICDGQQLSVQERMVYVLLNKPKNVITTTDDERGRTTVLDIVDGHYSERIFPVGRLDRDTTGLILITNDGDLANKLTHPSYKIQKQYRVGLRSPLTQADFEAIEKGVELEDGIVEVNWVRFSEEQPGREVVELEITSGRYRVVRRLFEHLGYEVHKLDRFYMAGLTKKDLERGHFRDLTQREITMLKHFTGHPSTAKKKKKKFYGENSEAQSEETDAGTHEEPVDATDASPSMTNDPIE